MRASSRARSGVSSSGSAISASSSSETRAGSERDSADHGPATPSAPRASSTGSPSWRAVRIAAWNVAARLLLQPRAVLGRAERQQQLGAHVVVDRARQLARPQRRAVVLRPPPPRRACGRRAGRRPARSRSPGPGARPAPPGRSGGPASPGAGRGRRRAARTSASPTRPCSRARRSWEIAVVERRPHERVGERVAPDVPGLAQHARLDALLQRLDELVARPARRRPPARRSRTRARSRDATSSTARVGSVSRRSRRAVTSRTPSGHAGLLERDLLRQRARACRGCAGRPPR